MQTIRIREIFDDFEADYFVVDARNSGSQIVINLGKRTCLPDGPKVGSVAVSPRGDLRMPSDASAGVWLEQLENMDI